MSNMIPTIGRRMWFFAAPGIRAANGDSVLADIQPFDAGVIFVYDEQTVNLSITDHGGKVFSAYEVHVRQPSDTLTESGELYTDQGVLTHWVEWMPYQQKVAAEQDAKDGATSKSAGIGLSYAATGGE